MQRPQTNHISTRSIDTAAFVMAASGQDCSVTFAGNIATFGFESNHATRDALVGFETGAEVEGRKLLEIRNQLFGDRIRYVSEFKKWLIWDGSRWQICGVAEIFRLAIEAVRSMVSDAQQVDDFPLREKIIKHSLASESAAKLKSMIEIAEKLPGVPIQQHRLDSDHFKLNVRNGTLNLKTGLPSEPCRDDYNTKQAAVWEH